MRYWHFLNTINILYRSSLIIKDLVMWRHYNVILENSDNTTCVLAISDNTVVSNHFHSVKILLFSSARSRDFDGTPGTELPVSMYTTKTPIDMCRFNVRSSTLAFSVKDRYQLNYFICIKDFNAETNTSLKLNLFFFLYLLYV